MPRCTLHKKQHSLFYIQSSTTRMLQRVHGKLERENNPKRSEDMYDVEAYRARPQRTDFESHSDGVTDPSRKNGIQANHFKPTINKKPQSAGKGRRANLNTAKRMPHHSALWVLPHWRSHNYSQPPLRPAKTHISVFPRTNAFWP
jgi:hypothetical protein